MALTKHLGYTHVEQRDPTAPENLRKIVNFVDFMSRWMVDDRLATPPGSPAEGDAYLIIATATGAWAGKENQIAIWRSGWEYLIPKQDWVVWVDDEDEKYRYSGSAWVNIPTPAAKQSAIADVATTVTSLTDSTGGSPSSTLQSSGFGPDIDDSLASLAANCNDLNTKAELHETKINAILAALRAHKLIQT